MTDKKNKGKKGIKEFQRVGVNLQLLLHSQTQQRDLDAQVWSKGSRQAMKNAKEVEKWTRSEETHHGEYILLV